MKANTDQARSAKVVAWLNMLDHCEAQLQALGALKNPVQGRGPCMADRVRLLKSELEQAREQNETLSYNLKTLTEAGKARKARAVARGRKSKATIAEVARRCRAAEWEVNRLQVAAKQVAASAEGNECVRVRLPRHGGPQVSLDGETWYDQKTGRKV